MADDLEYPVCGNMDCYTCRRRAKAVIKRRRKARSASTVTLVIYPRGEGPRIPWPWANRRSPERVPTESINASSEEKA